MKKEKILKNKTLLIIYGIFFTLEAIMILLTMNGYNIESNIILNSISLFLYTPGIILFMITFYQKWLGAEIQIDEKYSSRDRYGDYSLNQMFGVIELHHIKERNIWNDFNNGLIALFYAIMVFIFKHPYAFYLLFDFLFSNKMKKERTTLINTSIITFIFISILLTFFSTVMPGIINDEQKMMIVSCVIFVLIYGGGYLSTYPVLKKYYINNLLGQRNWEKVLEIKGQSNHYLMLLMISGIAQIVYIPYYIEVNVLRKNNINISGKIINLLNEFIKKLKDLVNKREEEIEK